MLHSAKPVALAHPPRYIDRNLTDACTDGSAPMKTRPFWEMKPLWLIGLCAMIGGGSASFFVKPVEPSDRIAAMIGGLVGGALVGLVLTLANRKKPRQ
jgi:H+/Cl- antiporter ClcA